MTTDQILMLDGRNEGTHEILQKVLLKIKPIEKAYKGFYEGEIDIPLEGIEKTIAAMVRKYAITPQWISMSYGESLDSACGYYSCGIKKSDSHDWLGTVSGRSLYELMTKLCILMYSKVRAGAVKEREKSAIEVKRSKRLEELDAEADARDNSGIY